ncbi:Vacuolar cation/proton exchanger 1 [Hibiscus syriacus]|uniref:Vacuolar cation/proton exchanger n=1 Tax=Hibiscus syriacus TaxID=106335 RepID=A0A6A2ZL59_HIBSY|nr:Vacuolar cation/proton exchanger 1 [Hibiscus syriacus]
MSSSLRKKSDLSLVSRVRYPMLRHFLANLQEVVLGTKLSVVLPVIPLAFIARCYGFGRSWVFALSLLGVSALAERISFLTEQIAYFIGPTVGGLVNATCGNAPELIIAIFALRQNKLDMVKYSLLASVLSNMLLVLGTSLLCGGIANLRKGQKFNRRQAEVNCLLLLLALLCHSLPLLFRMGGGPAAVTAEPTLQLSRASSVVMLIAYLSYLVFQLFTHRQFFEAEEEQEDEEVGESEEAAVIGFWSAIIWLVGLTALVSLLSEYIVETIEDASNSWGISLSFNIMILLPVVGNAPEHAGAIIFAFKDKLDISLGVALGSATQISMFVVPLCVVAAWTMGINMDLNFNLLETGSLALSIGAVAFALQATTTTLHFRLILILLYCVIGACFFVSNTPLNLVNLTDSATKGAIDAIFRA